MICFKCGASLPDNTPSVCPRCGAYNVPSGSSLSPSASQCVISIGGSPLMLSVAIIYTINIILSFINSLSSSSMDSFMSLYQLASILGVQSEISDLLDVSTSAMFISAVIGSLPAVIFVIGIWFVYIGASGQGETSKLPTGLKTISVMATVYLVFIAGIFIVLDIIILSLMGSAGSHADVFMFPLIVCNGVFAALIFYFRGIKKTVDSASYSFYANIPSGGSVYVAVVNFIIAGFILLSFLGSMALGNIGTVQMLNLLLTTALFLLFGILILMCRSKMSTILYRSASRYSNQPVYGTQYQPQPPQYQQQPQGQPSVPASDERTAADETSSSKNTASSEAPPTSGTDSWTCSCGHVSSGKFCPECGKKRPDQEWTCSCGHVNKGNFCTECGAKRPE